MYLKTPKSIKDMYVKAAFTSTTEHFIITSIIRGLYGEWTFNIAASPR